MNGGVSGCKARLVFPHSMEHIMRLTDSEREAILASIAREDEEAEVFLHGSRVDDGRRGGDIDLLVVSTRIDLRAKLRILRRIQERIGEQKIDLFVTSNSKEPFARLALERGVRL